MIELNLLPDVKLEYLRAKQTRRLVVSIAVVVTAVTVGLMALLFFTVNVVQKTHLSNLDRDIEQISRVLRETPDLDRVLTVQNQLGHINQLHDGKPVVTRLSHYIAQITPTAATIANLELDFANNTMLIRGDADSLRTINQFADTLKFTDYQIKDGVSARAFSSVVLRTFNRAEDRASYELAMSFDPIIFSSAENVSLVVPALVTTRSLVEKPGPLFQPMREVDPAETER
jgi:hypothetical protein